MSRADGTHLDLGAFCSILEVPCILCYKQCTSVLLGSSICSLFPLYDKRESGRRINTSLQNSWIQFFLCVTVGTVYLH